MHETSTLRRHLRVSLVLAALLTAAAASQAAQPAAADGFAAADTNGDGTISLSEFHADILRSWHRLDHDGDGFITETEVLGVPHPSINKALWRRMLRQADADHDGRISFKELVYARMDFFNKADADHDERLTRDEAAAFGQRSGSRGKTKAKATTP